MISRIEDIKVQSLQIAAKLIGDYKLKSGLIPLARKIYNFLIEDIDINELTKEVVTSEVI